MHLVAKNESAKLGTDQGHYHLYRQPSCEMSFLHFYTIEGACIPDDAALKC